MHGAPSAGAENGAALGPAIPAARSCLHSRINAFRNRFSVIDRLRWCCAETVHTWRAVFISQLVSTVHSPAAPWASTSAPHTRNKDK